jgi:hypothetical protein
MVSRAPPAIAAPSVLRLDWETLTWFASRQSKPPDLNACPTPSSLCRFMVQLINHNLLGFETQNKKPSWWFWGPNQQTRATDFEAQTGKPEATNFEDKPEETVSVILRSSHWQTVIVVLRQNHWQTIDLGFEAHSRNQRFSSSRAWCRPHTAPPDLSIAQPPSTRSVRPSSIICIRSPTPATILIAAHHATPATYTPRDKQMWFYK